LEQKVDIETYILNNPKAGRRELKNLFGISERQATKIKKQVLGKQEKPEKQTINEKDIAIKYLNEQGLSLESINEIINPQPTIVHKIYSKEKLTEFAIGLTGDSHQCDKACAFEEFHDYYDRCFHAGVENVLHAGDLTAGMGIYTGQEFDLTHHGFDEQLKNLVLSYPKRDGIITHAISGNHDESFTSRAGANIIEALANLREDINFLGVYAAQITINGVLIGLQHGEGGNCVQVSYKAQKYIDRMGAGTKPQIWGMGHYHTALMMFYRNIHVFLTGCFQKPNDCSVRKGLPNMLGSWILYLKVADDEHHSIRSINAELVSYYG